jgi:probable rRNA maturation factor
MRSGDRRRSRTAVFDPGALPEAVERSAFDSTRTPHNRSHARSASLRRARLSVAVSDERGRSVRAAGGLGPWLAAIAPARARGSVDVALVSDARVRALNREYRGHDSTTDVLSFPALSPERPPSSRRRRRVAPVTPLTCLGDIVIARGVARRQARAAGHSQQTELRVLALHGLLHLLGYDHERDAGRMERVERGLRVKGGLQAGLLERSRRAVLPGRASSSDAEGRNRARFERRGDESRAPRK